MNLRSGAAALQSGCPAQKFSLARPVGGQYLLTMSVATLQQVGQDFPAWVALAQRGETVGIMQAGKMVARLMPPEDGETPAEVEAGSATVRWPDFAARLLDEDRGA
jgi:antitoxin (DNA-binding transcriptional repressor) of toxin-antitoxin stability system